MNDPLVITEVEITRTPDAQQRAGLLGFLRLRIGDGLGIDGVTLRRTADGRMTLSWPARRDRQGRDHTIVRPLDEATRIHLERQVMDALRAQGELS